MRSIILLTSLVFSLSAAAVLSGCNSSDAVSIASPTNSEGVVATVVNAGCTVTQTASGATVSCADGSSATIEDGIIGIQGSMGATGPAGSAGAAGSTGPQGQAGNTGPTGIVGPTGPQGTQGVAGTAAPYFRVRDGTNAVIGEFLVGYSPADLAMMVGSHTLGVIAVYNVATTSTTKMVAQKLYYVNADCVGSLYADQSVPSKTVFRNGASAYKADSASMAQVTPASYRVTDAAGTCTNGSAAYGWYFSNVQVFSDSSFPVTVSMPMQIEVQ